MNKSELRTDIVIILVGMVASLLQKLVFLKINIFGSSPDILLPLIIILMRYTSLTTGIMISFFVGMSFDIFNEIIGVHSFSKTLLAFLAAYLFVNASAFHQFKLWALFFLFGLLDKIIVTFLYNSFTFVINGISLWQLASAGMYSIIFMEVLLNSFVFLKSTFYKTK